ncbi:26S proteasome non-ATPase regulatory subunit 8-like protein A [Nymphaea thermarum]|nr:26S proteasome non-ATPase regulatory subunit 8-like protein A [Nymphaea thermarum]
MEELKSTLTGLDEELMLRMPGNTRIGFDAGLTALLPPPPAFELLASSFISTSGYGFKANDGNPLYLPMFEPANFDHGFTTGGLNSQIDIGSSFSSEKDDAYTIDLSDFNTDDCIPSCLPMSKQANPNLGFTTGGLNGQIDIGSSFYDACTLGLSHLGYDHDKFYTELELLPASAFENPCITVELEQSFMEGAYNRVLSARQTVPHSTYVYYMDLLAKTVCEEIAGCSEKAYDYLTIVVAKQILIFSSEQEILEYITEEHPDWEVRNGCVFFQKAKETTPCKEIPSLQLIS